MIKKIIALSLVLILIVNFFAIALGKISSSIFWLILALISIIAYFFFPKETKIKKKRR